MTMLGQCWVNHTWQCCANVGPSWGQHCKFQKGNWLYTVTDLIYYMLSFKNANGGNVILFTNLASNNTLCSDKKCVYQKCYKFGRQGRTKRTFPTSTQHFSNWSKRNHDDPLMFSSAQLGIYCIGLVAKAAVH